MIHHRLGLTPAHRRSLLVVAALLTACTQGTLDGGLAPVTGGGERDGSVPDGSLSPSATTAGQDAAAAHDGPASPAPAPGPDAAAPPSAPGGPTNGPRAPWPMGTSYIQSGHSLTDTVMSNLWPGRLVLAVTLDPAGDFSDIAKATIPGSFISYRWNNPESGGDQAAQWPAQMPARRPRRSTSRPSCPRSSPATRGPV